MKACTSFSDHDSRVSDIDSKTLIDMKTLISWLTHILCIFVVATTEIIVDPQQWQLSAGYQLFLHLCMLILWVIYFTFVDNSLGWTCKLIHREEPKQRHKVHSDIEEHCLFILPSDISPDSVVHERVQKNAFIEHVHFYENDELNATSWQIMNLNGEHVHIIWGLAKTLRNVFLLLRKDAV